MMKSIFLILQIDKIYGGAERRLCRVAKKINMNDHYNVNIVAIGENKNIAAFVENEQLSEVNVIAFSRQWECFRWLARQRKAIVWFFNINKIGFWLAILRKKTIMTVANSYLSNWTFVSFKQKIVFWILCKLVTRIDCLYPTNKLGSKVTITPCPSTKVDVFCPKKKEKRIIFASRLIEGKNVMLCLQVINKIKRFLVDKEYIVFVYGEGKLKKQARDYILKEGLDDVVKLEGFTKMEEVLPYSKIFLSLQDITNYPSQVLLEAISSGNYIVATKTQDTDLLLKPEFGQMVEINIEDLSEAITSAITIVEDDIDDIYLKSARKFALNHFIENKSVLYFEEIFDRM